MTKLEVSVLEANIPRIKAERLLDDYDLGKNSPSPDALYDAALTATGNEEVANAYRVGRIKAEQRPAG